MKFRGGIHPQYNKITADLSVEALPLMEKYVVPVAQHLGAPGKLLVAKGDEVFKGQPLTEAAGFVSVPVHAPTSGKIKAIKNLPHPIGIPMQAIEITPDEQDTLWDEIKPVGNWRELDPATMKSAIQNAGVVGMGGATFPTHVKLSPPEDKPIDYLILNGAECEPYLTADHRVMLEQPADESHEITFVIEHFPFLQTSSIHRDEARTLWDYKYNGVTFPDILLNADVDVFLTGHTHTFEILELIRNGDQASMSIINISGKPSGSPGSMRGMRRRGVDVRGQEDQWFSERGWDMTGYSVKQHQVMTGPEEANQFAVITVMSDGSVISWAHFMDPEGVRIGNAVMLR